MGILQIIQELNATSSRLEKEAILRREYKNELLREFFFQTLNELHNFYVSEKAVSRVNDSPLKGSIGLERIFEADGLLDRLKNRVVTGSKAKMEILNAYRALSEDDAEVLYLILKRSPDCGVQASTVNKIWPDLVHTYPVLLAEKDEPKNRARIKFPAYAEFKCDGMRVNIEVVQKLGGAYVEYRARSGKALEINQADVDEAFIKMSGGHHVVYDGELLAFDNGKLLNRQTGNGIGNKAVRGTITPKEVAMLGFCIWDRVDIEEFRDKKGTEPYSSRIRALAADMAIHPHAKILPVERRLVNSWDEVGEWYADVVNNGGEGLLMKNVDHIWEDNRSRDLVKMKEVITGDFRVTGWNEGEGKFAGKLGALTISNKDGTIQCEVGGYNDADRAQFTPDYIIGKIIEVEYNGIVADKNRPGINKLFLPRFKALRLDKTVPE